MKILLSLLLISLTMHTSCKKQDLPGPPAKTYSADVAVAWMNLHMRLSRTTPGNNSVVSGRSFGYAGLTLYESIAPGIRGGQSVLLQLNASINNTNLPQLKKISYYWPASANAAMAYITKALFGNTSAANVATIDSLEAAFKNQFQSKASAEELQVSADFGKQVATVIFDWSKTDGGHEGYLNVTSASYVPPAGPGLWVPTPPAFSQPIHPYWGSNRSFVSNNAVTVNLLRQYPIPLIRVPHFIKW